MIGWVKLYRQSIKSAVFTNPNLWQVWCYCLMRANHEETKIMFNGIEIILKPGSFITGRYEGSKDCSMNPSTFRDQLSKLQKLKNLDITSDNKKSIITVVNWASYQVGELIPDTKPDNNPTTTRHRQEYKKERINIYDIQNLPIDLNGQLLYRNKYFYITQDLKEELIQKLQITLSDEELIIQFNKMEVWIEANKPKKNYKQFFINWFDRDQYRKQINSSNLEAAGDQVPAAHKYLI